MKITSEIFGTAPNGRDVMLFTLDNGKMRAKVSEYGAILTSVQVPDSKGKLEDVVLGFDKFDTYRSKTYLADNPYFGGIVGRYANRIGEGMFTLNNRTYNCVVNNGPNHLHGGTVGFDKKVWDGEKVKIDGKEGVRFTLNSPDGEEGYPGTVEVSAIYTLTEKDELVLDYEAVTDDDTHINLTNHSYFNLNGAKSDVKQHILQINASQYTVSDDTNIPTGEIGSVEGTPLDFRTPRKIGERIDELKEGYDHNYVLNNNRKLVHAAVLKDEESGRQMDVYTTEPGMQVYTSYFLSDRLPNRAGGKYKQFYGVCFEAQHYPDSPNKPEFPSTLLKPGEIYNQKTIFQFSVNH